MNAAGKCEDCGRFLSTAYARRCVACRAAGQVGIVRRVVRALFKQYPTAPIRGVARELGVTPQRIMQILRDEGLR